LEEKLVQLTEKQEFMKSVNKIVRSKLSEFEQYEELEALGLSHDEISNFMTEPEYGSKGFQRFELSNNLAKIKDTEAAIKRHKSMAEKEDTEYNYNGFKVSVCYSEERIRFYFDDIPDNDKKMLLKKSAFKWSPKNGAWQRQLTSNATIATKRLIKQFNNE
jgi:hypothetical protein